MEDSVSAKQKGKAKNIAGRVREAVEPPIRNAGYALWDVTLYKEAGELILEVAIDREGGISTDDCAAVTRLIDPMLDEMDPIEGSYCLMVSGAGSPRELREDAHLEYALRHACPVTAKTFASIDGKKQFEGTLKAFDKERIVLLSEGTERVFPRRQIAKLSALCEEVSPEPEDPSS